MKKSTPTVKQSVLLAFNSLPDTFRGNDIHRQVKILTGRKYVHIDSSLRKLRKLKSEGKVNYELAAEKCESLYHKL